MAHGSQVEHMERKAELHSNAVGDLKQDPESGKKQQTQIQQNSRLTPRARTVARVPVSGMKFANMLSK